MPTSQSAHFIVYAQYPHGPVIAVQVENEFGPSDPEHPGHSEYFALIEDTLRSNGITRIPLCARSPPSDCVWSDRFAMLGLLTRREILASSPPNLARTMSALSISIPSTHIRSAMLAMIRIPGMRSLRRILLHMQRTIQISFGLPENIRPVVKTDGVVYVHAHDDRFLSADHRNTREATMAAMN